MASAHHHSTSGTDRNLARLYEEDETGWLEATVRLIKGRQYDSLDFKHLIDYLQSMARSDRREVFSRLVTLLVHLLKWEHQPRHRSHSWRNTIRVQREELRDELSGKTLRHYAEEALSKAYARAVLKASAQTGLHEDSFSPACPYTLKELLSADLEEEINENGN